MMVALKDWTLIITLVLHFIFDLSSGLLPHVGRTNLMQQAAKYTTGSREEEDSMVVEFERKLLNLFGLKRRPNPGKDAHVPLLMQHLYKAHMGDTLDDFQQHNLAGVLETGFGLPSDDITSRINTARSFHHIDEDEYLPGMPDHHIRLRFDLSTLPDEESIGASELLLHREAIADHVTNGHFQVHRINIYEILKIPDASGSDGMPKGQEASNQIGGIGSQPITRLLDTKLLDSRNSTWERFDVSLATIKWARGHHNENYGLLVEVVLEDNTVSTDNESKRHVRLKRDLHRDLSDREWRDRKPTLITYTHDKKGKETNLQRRKRSSRKREANSSKKKRKRKRRNRSCARHNLYVDFAEVGWNDWIVAPHGYDAFYCHGQCLFPLAEHLNATNHAIVQTLASTVFPSIAPKPCCVPTELSSISMLYLDEYELVVLKNYQHMVVQACGCR